MAIKIKAPKVIYNAQRQSYLLRWYNASGKSSTATFPNKAQANKAKAEKVAELKAAVVLTAEYEEFSDKEKRYFYDLSKHAEKQGYDLWDAVRHYDKYLATSGIKGIKVFDAVPLCLVDKENDGVSKRYMQSLRSNLNRFKEFIKHKCKDLAANDVRHPEITKFVDGYKLSLRSRQGMLTDLRTFFSWCEQKAYCEMNPVIAAMPTKAARKKLMNQKRSRRKLQVLTPEEIKTLLTYCETKEPTLTPYACLCIWNGLRPEQEAPNMIDEDITEESVTVPEEIAKDGETRIIEPLTPNFIKWIQHIRKRDGSFQKVKNLKRKWEKAKKMIGRDWPHDGLRHSYASYHFAMYNDAGLTAKNLGHPNTTLLRKDYNGAATKAQAEAFFAILPKDCR